MQYVITLTMRTTETKGIQVCNGIGNGVDNKNYRDNHNTGNRRWNRCWS